MTTRQETHKSISKSKIKNFNHHHKGLFKTFPDKWIAWWNIKRETTQLKQKMKETTKYQSFRQVEFL